MTQKKSEVPITVGKARKLLEKARKDLGNLRIMLVRPDKEIAERAKKRIDQISRASTRLQEIMDEEHMNDLNDVLLKNTPLQAFKVLETAVSPRKVPKTQGGS
ncbi:hypothetical protein KW790_00880 [Candidatus Parcubacteria bacterium]|nr:hypothetical protein [Candidatus Parcubacteria bacterium]